MKRGLVLCILIFLLGCSTKKNMENVEGIQKKFLWGNATVYFMLTDRFYNGDNKNDFKPPVPPAPYRGYMGGDVKGITIKINEGYFDKLGVDAIWMTPLIENISEGVDEGSGMSYGFHGYWGKDWTAFDKRIGSKEDIAEMVRAAHRRGIKIIMDVVINHTGPVTPTDTKWPDEWVRTTPQCTYKGYITTTTCTLVKNLPDVRTESTNPVEVPDFLAQKWKNEGRYENEIAELESFFKRTGYPRRPYYYFVKWITDLISDFGIDGFRVDTAKHVEEDVWKTLYQEATIAYEKWKNSHHEEKTGDQQFYMVGEVYNYGVSQGRNFDFGDKKVDYFNFGFNALINFDFKSDAKNDYATLFNKYDKMLNNELKDKSTLNYISSHDDGGPFDKERKKPIESANKLLLTQGAAQIYYGDESARSLMIKASGDATLRSFMNWEEQKSEKLNILTHWQKVGKFRKNHCSVGAGKHHQIAEKPYVFARTYSDENYEDTVVCAIDAEKGNKRIPVLSFFKEGEKVRDFYSGVKSKVINGHVTLNTDFDIVLLAKE